MLDSDFDRNSQPLGAYPLRNGPVNDLTFDEEHEALTPGPIRPDVDGVIQQRSAAQHYRCLRDRAQAMANELRLISERPPEWYDMQKALLAAAGAASDAAQRMESGNE